MPSTYLVHHGIKGQKWGVRRYQNPDGSLTSEGQQRYSGKTDQYDKVNKRVSSMMLRNALEGRSVRKGGYYGTRGDYRAHRLNQKADKYQKKADEARADKAYADRMQKKANEVRIKAKAQETKNLNRDAYNRYTSNGKMLAQNLLLGLGSEYYRNARARGESRGRSFAEAMLGYPLSSYRDKKVYGAATI